MSKEERSWHSLPPLQKRVISNLAHKGPKTRNEVGKDVKSEWKNVRYSFRSLKNKGLIREVAKKHYRRQEFPQFWLTLEGILYCFLNQVPVHVFLKYAKEYYPKNREIHLFLELAEILPRRIVRNAYLMTDEHGKFKPEDAILSYIVYAKSGLRIRKKKLKEMIAIFRKYPEYSSVLTNTWEATKKAVEELDEVFSHE